VAAAREKAAKTQPPPRAPGMSRAVPPSKAGLTPGGMSALQLGQTLDNR
jgi:hypothetical protein